VRTEGNQKLVDLLSDDGKLTVPVDEILVGIGSAPNVEGMNLEAAGVQYDKDTGIATNDYLQTTNPRIYAAGDVCSGSKFPHIEAAAAQLVVHNALFWGRKRLSALAIPWCTYTDPEIAHVGLYIKEANAKGIPVKTFTVMMHDVDRAVTDGEDEGFVKIHVREGTDKILGATVAASHAGEMITEISLAMSAGIGLRACRASIIRIQRRRRRSNWPPTHTSIHAIDPCADGCSSNGWRGDNCELTDERILGGTGERGIIAVTLICYPSIGEAQ
jgi:pyruvate/2-oxoglutarate dehydrogenase complex dihydrolipoamide dehydrogenase (E3) component